MEFPESDLMQTLPKQFFAALVAKVNKKIAEGYDVNIYIDKNNLI